MTKLIKDMTENEREITVSQAWDIIKADYWDDVQNVTDAIISRMKDGEITDPEEWDTAIREFVDGTQRVIYTWQAKVGLLCTDNADAFQDVGLDSIVTDGDINWAALMFWAMRRDVEEQLDAEGYGTDWFERKDEEQDNDSEA